MEKQAIITKSAFAIKDHKGSCIVSYPKGFDKNTVMIKLLETDLYREVLVVVNNDSAVRYYKALFDSYSTVSSVNIQLDTAHRILRNESLYMVNLVIFTDVDDKTEELILSNPFMEAKIVVFARPYTCGNLPFEVIDTISHMEAKENNWLSNNTEYNLGINFSDKNKQAYKGLTETITIVSEIFKDSRKLITINGHPIFKSDFEVLFACVRGYSVGSRYFKSEEIINNIAKKKGWTQQMVGAEESYASMLDKFWNPIVIKENAVSYNKAVYSRNMMMANNFSKRDAVLEIAKGIELPAIIFNEAIEFTEDIAINLEKIHPSKICTWHSQIKSRLILDFVTGEYIKTKNGIPKKFGKESLKKMAIEGLNDGFYKILCTTKSLDSDISIPDLKTVVITSGNINPLGKIESMIRHDSLDKELIVINLYFKDFVLDNEIVKSRDLTKLILRQTANGIEPIWINSVQDVKC